MEITLKVQPDVVLEKSNSLNNEKSKIEGHMNELETAIHSLDAEWESSAATAYRDNFNKFKINITNMLHVVQEYISDLRHISEIYSAAESSAKAQVDSLPTSGVFGS